MNKKGFTLVELLGVIAILSIIMLIAIPNVTAVLERTRKDSYIADCKRFVSLVQYKLRDGTMEKPALGKSIIITLRQLNTDEIRVDTDSYDYDVFNSYVRVANEDGYLVYYVQLVAHNDGYGDYYHGISEVNAELLEGDTKYQLYKNSMSIEG